MANPAEYPENGPNRLFLDIPRLGIHIPLPPEYKPPVLETEGTIVEIEPPQPGDIFSIPRLGLHGTFEELKPDN